MTAPAKLATYEDLVALPEDVTAEVLGGELILQPGQTFHHGHLRSALIYCIGGPYHFDHDGPGGWWIVLGVHVRFTAHDIVRPDVIGWRRPRLDHHLHDEPIEVVPDWICEVLSPETMQRDRVKKSRLYASHGVPYYWLVDPDARLLEAFALDGGQWKLIGAYDETAHARIAPFEAVELPVGRLFLPAPPQP